MDFIPMPTGFTAGQCLQVPYHLNTLYEYEYDDPNVSYESVGERSGLVTQKDGKHLVTGSQEDMESLAQSWLYFGLLSVLLGRKLEAYSFIDEESQTIVSSRVAALIDEIGQQKLAFPSFALRESSRHIKQKGGGTPDCSHS